ncbi:MAG: hypothetical protein ACOCWJ_02760 [Verrucomicrobiota bacterium]
MTDFLSSRLHSVKRFAPKETPFSVAPANSADSDGGVASGEESAEAKRSKGDAGELTRHENRAAANQAFRTNAQELSRQRREMLTRLDEHARALEHEQDRLAAHVETVERLRADLEKIPETIPDENPSALRELRRAVESARLELAREARHEAERASEAPRRASLENLGFARLFWWGLAAALPLILGVLLAAGLIAFALLTAFGM